MAIKTEGKTLYIESKLSRSQIKLDRVSIAYQLDLFKRDPKIGSEN